MTAHDFAERDVHGVGRVTGAPFVVLAHVEQEGGLVGERLVGVDAGKLLQAHAVTPPASR